MAIVINGSGTVTGLAVGGLPDGTVDAGTLATDSVVTGKIADGAILNADINSSAAIAGSKINGSFGKVLQVVYITGGTGVTYNSSTTEVSADLSGAITPSSTSSKIIIIGRLELTKATGGNDAGISLSLRRGSSGISNAKAGWTNSSIYQQHQITHTFLDSPSTTNATTYSYFWGSQLSGTNTNIARERNMILMEIAG